MCCAKTWRYKREPGSGYHTQATHRQMSSVCCNMLRSFGQIPRNMLHHDPTMLRATCCIRLARALRKTILVSRTLPPVTKFGGACVSKDAIVPKIREFQISSEKGTARNSGFPLRNAFALASDWLLTQYKLSCFLSLSLLWTTVARFSKNVAVSTKRLSFLVAVSGRWSSVSSVRQPGKLSLEKSRL